MSARPSIARASSRRPRRTRADRNRLIVRYRPYVVKLARQLAEVANYHVEIDDLVGWGHMGLVEAAARFDETRGVTFRTFAHRRIQGAMFDGIRKHYGPPALVPLQDAVADMVADCALESTCADGGYAQVRYVLEGELRAAIAEALAELTPVEQEIVRHHYFDDEPVIELTRSTSFSKSWLSRLHARALGKMRAALLARERTMEAYL